MLVYGKLVSNRTATQLAVPRITERNTAVKRRKEYKRYKVRPFYFSLALVTALYIAFNIYLAVS